MSEVLFIGTSDAFGAGGRRQSAVLFRGDGGNVLLDCGATTNSGLADLGVSRDEIDAVLISHYHGDHFGGLPLFLFAALYEDERKHGLTIAGPPEIEARVRGLARAMGHGMEDREWNFPLRFIELGTDQTHSVGPASVDAFETRHQLEAHPHGYRVRMGGTDVVYSGDTGWFDELPRLAAGADLFICECTLHHAKLDFHLNLDQLSENKRHFDCGQMILTHLGAEMSQQRGEVEAFETADDGLLVKL